MTFITTKLLLCHFIATSFATSSLFFSTLLFYSILKFNHILLIIKLFIFSLSFCFKKNVIFYLNSNKRKLCSSNCTHFFNIYTFSNLSPSLYLFIPPKHSTFISLSLFPFIFLYFVSFYYHPLSINLSFTLLFFT